MKDAKSALPRGCMAVHEDVVSKLRGAMPTEAAAAEVAELFKVFSDSTRVKILWALDARELCVCDISALLGMSKSAVSHQLARLRQTNLVSYRREGKEVYYALADDHVRQIFEKAAEHLNEEENA